ncbi:hypothetical protein ACFQDF_17230 [Ectobacillus funiculus]
MKYLDYNYENHIMLSHQVLKLIDMSMLQKKGFSLARFGIGEITYLTNKASAILVQQFEHYKSYAGMTCSLDEMRRQLIQALKSTDIAGLIPASRLDFWGKLPRTFCATFSSCLLKFAALGLCTIW